MGEHQEDLRAIVKAAVTAALDARARVPNDEHREHHEFVAAMIARQRARAKFWNGLAAKSLPAIVVALIVSAATAIWHLITTHVHWG